MGRQVRNLSYATPTQGDTLYLERVKYFENADPIALQDAINFEIASTLLTPTEPDFFINDIQFGNYLFDEPPIEEIRHFAWLRYTLLGG